MFSRFDAASDLASTRAHLRLEIPHANARILSARRHPRQRAVERERSNLMAIVNVAIGRHTHLLVMLASQTVRRLSQSTC
jgi:hypothetical protein